MAGTDSPDPQELARRWADTWLRAALELDRIRRREIRNLDGDSAREIIRQLFTPAAALENLPPRTTSGLVEQQAWFAKLRK